MTKTNYGFGGWYKEENCINQWNFTADTVTGDITLYAKWDTNYHTVNFEANGGNPAPDSQNITHGGKVVMPPAMTKTNYGFGGWYKDTTYTNQWNFATDTVTGNITLYAMWDTNYYTVNFEANGGNPAPDSQNIAHGDKVVMPPAMTKTGYGFVGWYKEAGYINLWDFDNYEIVDNITLHAKWLAISYTVTFNADGGTPSPPQQNIINGGKVSKPENIAKEGYTLQGWYKDASYTNLWDFDSDTVTNNIILYAKWGPPIVVSGNTLAAKLQWLSANAASNSGYILEVTATYEELAPQNLSYTGKKNITIRLKGIGNNARVIVLSGNGSLFSVGNGVTLILEENLILQGKGSNTASLVRVNSGGTLTMNQSVKISGNIASSSSYGGYGGGVYVDGGTFTMNGGEISGNTAYSSSYGGGVYVDRGTFTMNGGEISDNTAYSFSSSSYGGYGGGVYVSGIFTMNGGEISGNTAHSYSSSSYGDGGGGVYVSSGTFTISGGKISGNTASSSSYGSYGGGVYVDGGTFTMEGGEISGNTSSYGGGVYVNGETFTMEGGEISGNTSYSHGGGVYVDRGTFTMNGGEISGNTTDYPSSYGGGVYVYYNGTFTMSGGEISGNTSSYGGGVSVNGETFTMNGGEISGNTSSYGGGVSVSSGTFTMNGGKISGNTSSYGGGVYVNGGTFTMNGGEISGNTSYYGGGMYVNVHYVSFFEKTGGTIYGYTAGNSKSNTVKNNSGVVLNDHGHAVYVNHYDNNSYIKRKETTAGPGDNLSYIGRLTPPIWDGVWDF
jgi:uncharacterized repeat protein (TIGR02543 family)